MEKHARQEGLIGSDLLMNSHIAIIGVGGLGSFTAFSLSKMGIGTLTLFDNDKVELHNVSNQLYRTDDLGKSKVLAMKEIITEFDRMTTVNTFEVFADKDTLFEAPIVISSVDSMQARKNIFEACKASPGVSLLLDARMGAEELRVFEVNMRDEEAVKMYEASLYDDSEALQLPCTARAIIYTGFMCASVLAAFVKSHLTSSERGTYREIAVNVPLMQVL